MIKKIVCLGALVIVAFSIIGCTNGKKINFEVEEGFYTQNSSDHPGMLELVKSEEELELLCDEYGLINESQKYDDEFFNENALVLYLFINSRYTYQFNAVRVKNGTLVISATRWGDTVVDEATRFSYIIKIKQTDLKDVKDVEVDMKIKNRNKR